MGYSQSISKKNKIASEIEKFIIKDVKDLADKLDYNSLLLDEIKANWDEEEKSIEWLFNPVMTDEYIIEGMDIQDYGVEIIVHEENDLPCLCWGSTIIGDDDDVADNLTNGYIGDESIKYVSDDLYNYIKRQFKDNLPDMENIYD